MEKKIYYTIGEVSKAIDVPDYVIRYWEREFEHVSPDKRRGGKRLYRQKDIENLEKVKHYLYNEKYTIEGAKKLLSSKNGQKIVDGDNQTESLFTNACNKNSGYLKSDNSSVMQVVKEAKNDLLQLLKKISK